MYLSLHQQHSLLWFFGYVFSDWKCGRNIERKRVRNENNRNVDSKSKTGFQIQGKVRERICFVLFVAQNYPLPYLIHAKARTHARTNTNMYIIYNYHTHCMRWDVYWKATGGSVFIQIFIMFSVFLFFFKRISISIWKKGYCNSIKSQKYCLTCYAAEEAKCGRITRILVDHTARSRLRDRNRQSDGFVEFASTRLHCYNRWDGHTVT